MKLYHHIVIIACLVFSNLAFGVNYTISGNAGASGVTMSGLPGNPVSDSNGAYSGTVSSGWSGTVTPTKTGYTFTPTSRTYTNVTANQSGQNYTAAVNFVWKDNFDGNEPNQTIWMFFNPLNDASVTVGGGALSINVPAGLNHDAVVYNTAPRLMQDIADVNFTIQTKFTSEPALRFQEQGLRVEQDKDNYLLFYVYFDGSEVEIYSADFINDEKNQIRLNYLEVEQGVPYYLRIARAANQWTLEYSYDGNDWNAGASFTSSMTVRSVGLFAGNLDWGNDAPAFNGVADYFWNTVTPIVTGTNHYVATDGNDNNNGLTLQTAFRTVQKGVNISSNRDTVIVYPGTYTRDANSSEVVNFNDRRITIRSSNPSDPNVVAATILDANVPGTSDGRVVVFNDRQTLEGFTIKGGYLTSGDGGGIYCDNASPTISKCVIANNKAENGGGLCSENSVLTISDCTFSANTADNEGGGIYNWYSTIIVSNCSFSGNLADGTSDLGGGAISNDESTVDISQCVFTDNTADNGGAIKNDWESDVTITDCNFISNTALASGGAIGEGYESVDNITWCNFTSNRGLTGGGAIISFYDTTIENCTFTANDGTNGDSGGKGGAVYFFYTNSPIKNCLFNGNISLYGGDAIQNIGSSPIISNCTFINHGYIVLADDEDSNPAVANCIFWDPEAWLEISPTNLTNVRYCDISGGYSGAGNINIDPNFAADGYHLTPGSPCINAGDPNGNYTGQTDIDGQNRVYNGRVDIGVDEYVPTYTISGSIGLDGVTMSGLLGNPVTSGGGLYSATVTYGWSGTVTPTKTGYTFTPTNRVYANITANQSNQNYTGAQGNYACAAHLTIGCGGYAIVGKAIVIDGSASSTNQGSIVKYEWDWTNDGTYDYNETSTVHADGAFDGRTAHAYSMAGTYTVKLRVTDSGNNIGVTTADVNVSPDTDNDNMPDAWETKYGITGTNHASSDKDGDGSSNLREYLCGTNPSDINSKILTPINIYVPSDINAIQKAIDASRTGDTIIVAIGTYHESINLGTKNITVRSSDPNNPNCVSQTIIDANSFAYGVQVQGNATIDGFTIKNANSGSKDGIYYSGSYGGSPIIRNCVITNNAKGAYFDESTSGTAQPTLQKCTIYGNTTQGVYLSNGYNSNVGLLITDCNILSNMGDGIYHYGYYSCPISVVRCRIIYNGADGFCSVSDSATIYNSVIAKNGFAYSSGYGGGINLPYGGSVTNCTVYGNRKYGIRSISNSSCSVLNTIVWNTSVGYDMLSVTKAIYCCTGNQVSGAGNFCQNPKFKNADANDFHLDPNYSPCVDTGAPWSDYSNEPMPNGGRINMGAYGNTSEAERTVDRDSDGISDGWEKTYWPNDDPNKHNPSDIPKGDGFTNYTKYLFGYPPTTTTIDANTVKYVVISTPQFDPTKGEYVDITSWVNRPTTLTVKFSDKVSGELVYSATNSATIGGNTIRWYGKDTSQLIANDSNYTITVDANDNFGHTDHNVRWGNVGIIYAQRITGLQCNPYRIIPLNNEVSAILFTLTKKEKVVVNIYDPYGNLFWASDVESSEPNNILWSGKNTAGTYYPAAGEYKVQVHYDGMREKKETTLTICR